MQCLGGVPKMFSLFSFSPFGREMRSGVEKRRLRGQPRLEALEDRTLLATWTTVTAMPTARADLAGALGSNGQVYAVGGFSSFVAFNTVEAYNTASGSWSTRASLNVARGGLGGAAGLD